jgi:hypothetical protein
MVSSIKLYLCSRLSPEIRPRSKSGGWPTFNLGIRKLARWEYLGRQILRVVLHQMFRNILIGLRLLHSRSIFPTPPLFYEKNEESCAAHISVSLTMLGDQNVFHVQPIQIDPSFTWS